MSRRIVVEALVVVVQLRAEELRGRWRRRDRRVTDPQAVTGPRPARPRRPRRASARSADAPRRRACASCSTRGRSRNRTARRSRPPTSTACSGAFDAEPLAGRVVRVPARSPTSTTRPTRYEPSRRRRPATPAADPAAALGGADRRPVPAARRLARRGLARRARRCGRRRLPRGRRRAAADRLGPAGRGRRCSTSRPWELPEAFAPVGERPLRPAAAGPAPARRGRGHRRRARPWPRPPGASCASGRDRLRVVPLAPRPAFVHAVGPRRSGWTPMRPASAERLGLPERYLVYSGRYDARHDLATLLRALAALAAAGRPDRPARRMSRGHRASCSSGPARTTGRRSPGPPRARASASAWPTRPRLPAVDLAGLVRGARAAILPVRLGGGRASPAIEAIACGTPVVASAVGAAARAGRRRRASWSSRATRIDSPSRCATIWTDDRVHERIAANARERRQPERRTWADVARETRAIYAEVGIRRTA